MMRFIIFLFFLANICCCGIVAAQHTVDSLQKKDTLAKVDTAFVPVVDSAHIKDSIIKAMLSDSAWIAVAKKYPAAGMQKATYQSHPYFNFQSKLIIPSSDIKVFHGKEWLFYLLTAIVLLFAVLKLIFPKYLGDLFKVTFRSSLKQMQISEQMIQTPLPSLLLNIFFVITGGLFIALLLQHYDTTENFNFWLMSLYALTALAIIYATKFIMLKFTGWLFNLSAVTDSYIFVVFQINKVIGVFLLPFLWLLAFPEPNFVSAIITLSSIGLGVLLLYRVILSYGLVRNEVKVNPFHFLLYFLAFEIIPIMVIYKAIMLWF